MAQKITTPVKIKIRIVSTQASCAQEVDSEFLARTILTERNPITKPIGYIHFSKANPRMKNTRPPAAAALLSALMTLRFTFEATSTAKLVKKTKKASQEEKANYRYSNLKLL
jgi:hypothetical protein